MSIRSFAAVLASLLFVAGAAYAGDASDNGTKADPMICKTTPPPTGTRIGGQRICMTASQWRAQRQLDQDALSHQQNQSQYNQVPTPGG